MSGVKVVWATPDIDKHLAYIARVSNPENQQSESVSNLLKYMEREGHVSPFDMCNVCLEINAPRDIARQALRHWSIKPQEFSQRYQDVSKLGDLTPREFRLQDKTNRQASIDVEPHDPRAAEWERRQLRLIAQVKEDYEWCIANGGAKEVARVVLPEGLTPSRMYFNGTMRSWVHYLRSRLHASTQKEHRQIALGVFIELQKVAPITMSAFFPKAEE